MPSDHQLPYKDSPLNREDQSSDRGFSVLNEDLTEAKTREAFTDVRRIAEEGREVRLEHENKLKHEAHDRVRRELIGLIIDIRDKLIIGLRSTSEGRRKLDEYQNSSRLCKIFINKIAGINHTLEVVHALQKGYRLGLDRLDETLQQLEVHEIASAGQPFDPQVMNAVDLAETVDATDGMVLEVYRTGYMIDSEVLRPAQVKVARTPMQNMQFQGENRDREGTKKNSHLTLK